MRFSAALALVVLGNGLSFGQGSSPQAYDELIAAAQAPASGSWADGNAPGAYRPADINAVPPYRGNFPRRGWRHNNPPKFPNPTMRTSPVYYPPPFPGIPADDEPLPIRVAGALCVAAGILAGFAAGGPLGAIAGAVLGAALGVFIGSRLS